MKTIRMHFCWIVLLLMFNTLTHAQTIANKISYHDQGQGTPLILIHAFPTSQQLWTPQWQGLSAHFRVITLDLWGFGESAATDGKAVTMANYADEVRELMDQLHIHTAIIGGESMGGYVALAFLQKYPERVSGLVLSDTQAIADSREAKNKREASAADILEHGPSNFIRGFMPKALSPNATPNTQTFLQNIVMAQAPTAMASALRGMALRDDTSSLLAQTHLPTLIITGEDDTLISPQQSAAMHALAKNSKLVQIAKAGHLSSLEQPESWNRAVVEFFSETHGTHR